VSTRLEHLAAIEELAGILADIGDRHAIYAILHALLTPPERRRIALRWQLVRLLETGLSQRAVSARLGVSLCKITRGARELKHGPTAFHQAVRLAVARRRRRVGGAKGKRAGRGHV
jgi:TrpR family trp operon transcriptional repressor